VETRSSRRATLSLPSDTEILIVRDFDAPKALVFDAWAKPEFIRRWYGCRQFTMTACDVDFREGGKWRWVLRNPEEGVDHAFSGVYREIAYPDRLVFTELYEMVPGSDHVVTLTFDEQNSVTRLTMRIRHQSQQHRDGHLHAGMEPGMQETLDRLEELLAVIHRSSN
jgi:uncharacterized protein YndB with AHSA1/START domain